MDASEKQMDLRRRLVPDMMVLRTFDSAVRHANFTRAAEELHLTQSSVSRQIKDLEDQLGTALFTRVRRQVVLTPAGRQFHAEAAKLLRDTESMMLRAMNTREDIEVLRVAAPPTFASRWLVPRLHDFSKAHPGVQIDLLTRAEPFSMQAESCDLAFHFGDPVWPHGHCRYLCREVVRLVCAPSLIQDSRETLDGLLSRMPLLQNAARPMMWPQWFEQCGRNHANPLGGPRFDTFSALAAAAVAGMGLALLPDYLIESELARGQLVDTKGELLETEAAYHLVTPEEGMRSPLVEQLISHIRASLGNRRIIVPR